MKTTLRKKAMSYKLAQCPECEKEIILTGKQTREIKSKGSIETICTCGARIAITEEDMNEASEN